MASKKQNSNISAFEKECVEVARQILEYKTACEGNIVAILYKNPSLFHEIKLTIDDFHNNIWRVYFEIAYEIIVKEGKNVLDNVIVGTYLEKHKRLEQVYQSAGGYEMILDAGEYVKEEAFDGYVNELNKWSVMIKLTKRGWVDKNRMSEYADMSAQDIYDEFQVYLNDIFINIDHDVHSYDVTEGLNELIDRLDNGMAVGLSYKDMPMTTAETGGMYLGSITLIGALSNVGKSSFIRNTILPSIIRNKERIVIMLNEEDRSSLQRELIIIVANNVLGFDIQKHVLRDGHFTNEIKDQLHQCADWIRENVNNHMITIIPFQQYRTETAIKVIKKYASMGVKYFILDTFKMDAGKVSNNAWLEMQQNMVAINDVIKPEVNNLHITITFQLSKGTARQRYYTQDNIGLAKNIVDPVSTCLMIRDVYDDEKKSGKRALKVYRLGGKNGKSKIPVTLENDKHYQVIFLIKNRAGSRAFEIVIEVDLSRNIVREVGITKVPIDTF